MNTSRLNARNLGIGALALATVAGGAIATTAQQAQTTPVTPATELVDGTYTGDSVRASHWGSVQVTAIIENGQLVDFEIADYPHMRRESLRISQVAIPRLMQEAVDTQSADLDIITGATPTSTAFMESLQSALDQAATGESSTTATGVSL